MVKRKSSFSKTFILCLGVLVTIFLFNYLVLAWTEPNQTPPEGNIPAPLNVGFVGQQKAGGLILNTGNATTGLIVLGDQTNPSGGSCPSDYQWYDLNLNKAIDNGECIKTILTADRNNVGIGTLNPLYKLDVNGNVHASGDICTDAGGGKCLSSASGPWTVSGDNIYYGVVSGNVGIGTNFPAKKLEVKGDVLVTDICNSAGACLSMLNDFIGSQPLVNNRHTRADCVNAGGTVINTDVSFPQCRFSGGCPLTGGWEQYKKYSATVPGSGTGWQCPASCACNCYPNYEVWGICRSCTTGSHAWSNTPIETCQYANMCDGYYVSPSVGCRSCSQWVLTAYAGVAYMGCY